MNHKMLVRIAIVMVVVFGLTIVVYPLIFSPEPSAPIEKVPTPPTGP